MSNILKIMNFKKNIYLIKLVDNIFVRRKTFSN